MEPVINCYIAGLMGSFVVGTAAGLIGAVSKYVLPKLGYHTVSNIPIANISTRALSIAVRSYATFFLLALVFFALESVVLNGLDSHLHPDD
jgi:hypothetical protein